MLKRSSQAAGQRDRDEGPINFGSRSAGLEPESLAARQQQGPGSGFNPGSGPWFFRRYCRAPAVAPDARLLSVQDHLYVGRRTRAAASDAGAP